MVQKNIDLGINKLTQQLEVYNSVVNDMPKCDIF